MPSYKTSGKTTATSATADHGVGALWNPHASVRLKVWEIQLVAAVAPGAGAEVYYRRITARGTPAATVTPGIAQELGRNIAPPSGALLDLGAYSVEPTFDTLQFDGWVFSAVQAAGLIVPFPRPIEIPPGAGLCIATAVATIFPVSRVAFGWDE